jgi:hypothetical protein
MKRFKSFLIESVGAAGLEYENKVYSAMKSANVNGLNPGDKPGAGFSNQGAGDIEASYKGSPFNIEIKATPNDQMGGMSFRYDMDSKQFQPSKEIDPADLQLLLSAAKEKISDIDNYIKAARELEPKEYHKNINGVPLKVSKEGRDQLKKKGLLAKINKNSKAGVGFIVNHYNKKGVFYIQIGGAGLFYLGKNPLKLPVPALKGEIRIEMRLAFAGGGSPFPTDPPTPARTAGLRLQGRLVTKGKSPYSLDNSEDVKKLFGE